MNLKRFFILGIVITIIFSFQFLSGKDIQDPFQTKYKYNFIGKDAQGGRTSKLSFNINDDGTLEGIQIISKVCQTGIYLAGGKICFKGILTTKYPQAAGTFKGITTYCNDKNAKIEGTIKIGYHSQYGVFTQLFNGAGGEEYYHRNSCNPFE